MKQQIEYPELPRLIPRPAFTAGVAQPVVSLNGTWQICYGADINASPSALETS